jgi:hypothetical protein
MESMLAGQDPCRFHFLEADDANQIDFLFD